MMRSVSKLEMAAVQVKLGVLSDRLGCYDLDHQRVWTQAALLELGYTPGDARLYVMLWRAGELLANFNPPRVIRSQPWALEHQRLQLERQQRHTEQLERQTLEREFPF